MNLNPISSFSVNNKYTCKKPFAPKFGSVIGVYKVTLDGSELYRDKDFRLAVDACVRALKDTKKVMPDMVKTFWDIVNKVDPSRAIKRCGLDIVTGKEARTLFWASEDLSNHKINEETYSDLAKSIRKNRELRLKLSGIDGISRENGLIIEASRDKKGKIVVESMCFEERRKFPWLKNHDATSSVNPVASEPVATVTHPASFPTSLAPSATAPKKPIQRSFNF